MGTFFLRFLENLVLPVIGTARKMHKATPKRTTDSLNQIRLTLQAYLVWISISDSMPAGGRYFSSITHRGH